MTDSFEPDRSPQVASGMTLTRAIPAVTLIVLSWGLWELWARPTMGFRTASSPTIPSAPQSFDGLYTKGSLTAPVGLIVYADFECPFCARFAREVLPSIEAKYVASGDLTLAFSDLPLRSIHPSAFRRSMIAECAGHQGKFWDIHDRFFAAQTAPDIEVSVVADLDQTAMSECMAGAEKTVRQKLATATALGLTSTPTLLVGNVQEGRLIVTEVIVGMPTVSRLSSLISRHLQHALARRIPDRGM